MESASKVLVYKDADDSSEDEDNDSEKSEEDNSSEEEIQQIQIGGKRKRMTSDDLGGDSEGYGLEESDQSQDEEKMLGLDDEVDDSGDAEDDFAEEDSQVKEDIHAKLAESSKTDDSDDMMAVDD